MRLFKNGPRQTLRKLHSWTGIVVGGFIVMMSLTGFVSVYRNLIEGFGAPPVTSPGHAPDLSAMERSVVTAWPDLKIGRVSFPVAATDPLVIQLAAQTGGRDRLAPQLYVDPATGKILGLRKPIPWLEWIVDLHQNLLMGKSGRSLTGLIGIPLLLISLSGLWSWLAGRRDWKRSLSMPMAASPWQSVVYRWHQWAGLWTSLLLVAVSATGIVLAYPDTFQQLVGSVSGMPRPPRAPRDGNRDKDRPRPRQLPLDRYVAAAVEAVPNGVVRELRLPGGRGRPAVSLTLWTPGDARPKGANTVVLDVATAKVFSAERSAASPPSRQFTEWANAIHKTELGGMPMKLVWSLGGLAPILLFVSGFQIWWNQRKAAARAARRVPLEKAVQVGAASRT